MKPLRYSQQCLDESDIAAVVRVMRSDWLTQGPEVEAFEAELAAYVGAKHCVAVSSGTAALHLALVAGSGAADLAITSPLSFVASANAAVLAGKMIDFCDVDPATGNVDWSKKKPTPSMAVHVPVHYAGRACDLSVLKPWRVIEDACHALGAMDFDGCSRVGSCAHSLATCFSFHPVKPITTGEGGAITTNNIALAGELTRLRSHGRDMTGRMVTLGYNYRMTEIQAALGRSQLQRCDEMLDRRRAIFSAYELRFAEGLDEQIAFPYDMDMECALHLLPVRIKSDAEGYRSDERPRDRVKRKLNEQGIMAQVHYPCIHLQPYYRERFGYKEGAFPEAEAWAAEELSLPLHARMTEADVDRVCKALKEALV